MTDSATSAISASDAHIAKITAELDAGNHQVRATAELLDGGATVPFIARYRKEATGGLDEVVVIAVRDRLEQLRELDKRRQAILKSLQEQNSLSDELKAKVLAAETLSVLEDIYLPFRPKRRTRATIAKERGLEPLAKMIFEQSDFDCQAEAGKYVDVEKEVSTAADALAGARDIIAEWINENADARSEMRRLFEDHATLVSKAIPGKAESPEAAKYKDYFEWSEPLAKAPSHRVLAIRRGAKEGFLTFHAMPDETLAIGRLKHRFLKASSPAADEVAHACEDCYKRMLSLSMETEIRLASKKRADEEAIAVFADNLRELLLASPLGSKKVLGIDPGLRTGCKVVCLDQNGKLLHNATIYPLVPANRTAEATVMLKALVQQFDIEAVAIGNGTGGRECETFCRGIDFGRKVAIISVNESGASVYSASAVAREEFPDYDLTVRGSVSIGRRLMDPLAELVKIDPKSIGVGQYQHDVEPRSLKSSLDDVVQSCVNAVGVEVNTASKQLLSYVSGLSERLAGNFVTYRNDHGAFRSRREMLKVAGMGPKTFEQAAGFLRIRDAENPLDASAVHPESYGVVEKMAGDLRCSVAELVRSPEQRAGIELKKYVTDKIGMPTLTDIMAELAKPGRDPRKQFEAFSFAEGVSKIADVTPGMKLPGIVTNVTAFGAFVDIGVHQDGLVHISQLADRYIEKPSEVVKVQQKVMVTVLEVDLQRQRIALSMRTKPQVTTERGDRTSPAKPVVRGQSKPQSKQSKQSRPQPGRQGRGNQPPTDRNNPFGDLLKKWKP